MIATIKTSKGLTLKEVITEDDWTEGTLLFHLEKELTELFVKSGYKRKDYCIPELGIKADILKINSPTYRYQIHFFKDGKLMSKNPCIIKTKEYAKRIEKMRIYNMEHLNDD